MPADAATFFTAFFRELGNRGIPYAILHGYEQLPEQMPSDIDYVVRCADLPRLLPIQRAVAKQCGWRLVSVVQAKLHAQYAVFFDPENPAKFIQLDACGHYVERGCFVLRDDQLLEGRQPFRSLYVPAPAMEFGYLLAKALIKKKPLAPYLPRLKELWSKASDASEQMFLSLVGGTPGELKDWFNRPALEWDEQLRPRILAQTRFGLLNLIKEGFRALRRILRPVGMRIVILGPDGVGKSTLIAQLCLPCFRRVKQFHFRPCILGKASPATVVTQPHAQASRSAAASWAKAFYYFVDHWLGYVLRVLPAKIRNELVVFDRSFEDVFVDPKRYRLTGAEGLARGLSRLLPRPELIIILDAEPEIVHARKPELSLEELRRQREVLRQMANRSPRCVVVSASQTPAQVAHAVQVSMISCLAERETRWHGA